MKKLLLKATTIFLVMAIMLAVVPMGTFAASVTLYESAKASVPIWSSNSSKSTKVYRIEDEGTILEVVSGKKNSEGNLWYRLKDGNWVFSGNVKKHSHAGSVCIFTPNTYAQKDSNEHFVTVKDKEACKCGFVVKDQLSFKTEAHSFSGEACTRCGFKKIHTHQASIKGEATYSYASKDSTSHTATIKTPNLCSCGQPVNYSTATKTESHSYNAQNTCTKCGTHTHKLATLKKVGDKYYSQSNTAHIYEEEIAEICYCGQTLHINRVQTLQQHKFDSDKCACGYTKESTEHKHMATKRGEAYTTYSSKDNKSHFVIEKAANLCKCGAVVDIATLSTREEPHNFKNDICKDCNVEKSYDFLDVNASQIIEEALKGNYSEDVTLAGIGAEILVGETPIGFVADVRDVMADIQNDAGFIATAVDAIALLPFGGIIKCGSKAVTASQAAKKVVKTEFFAEGTKQAKKYSEGVEFTIGPGGKAYPRFEKWSIAEAKFKKPTLKAAKNHTGLSGNYYWDSKLANELNGFSKTPSDYVWHHVEDMQTMILVPQDLHSSYFGGMSHVGGASIIKEYLNLK